MALAHDPYEYERKPQLTPRAAEARTGSDLLPLGTPDQYESQEEYLWHQRALERRRG